MSASQRAILAALFGALLSACTVGPEYQRPALRLPASYNEAQDAAGGVDLQVVRLLDALGFSHCEGWEHLHYESGAW